MHVVKVFIVIFSTIILSLCQEHPESPIPDIPIEDVSAPQEYPQYAEMTSEVTPEVTDLAPNEEQQLETPLEEVTPDTTLEDQQETPQQEMAVVESEPLVESDSVVGSSLHNHEELSSPTEIETPTKEPEVESVSSVYHHKMPNKARQKIKEKYCMAKMTKCLANDNMENMDQDLLMEISSNLSSEGPNEFNADTKPNSTFVHCSSQNFKGLARCCSNMPRNIFQGAILFACSENLPSVPREALNEYILNRGQAEDNSLDLSSAASSGGSMLWQHICFVECIFRKRYLVTADNQIHLGMVRRHFAGTVGSVWSKAAVAAVNKCAAAITRVHPSSKMMYQHKFKESTCLVHPFLLLQCVRHALLTICPSPSSPIHSPECTSSMEKLKLCDIFKTMKY